MLALVGIFQPETYHFILLKWKASHLREMTGDDRYSDADLVCGCRRDGGGGDPVLSESRYASDVDDFGGD